MYRLLLALLLWACASPASSIGCDSGNVMINNTCVNPCLIRTVLNEPWRSAANIFTNEFVCDSDKNGWYQFNGTGGVQLPNTCVPSYRCNTDAPIWMQGAHPAVSDNIVNRTACTSWTSGCCVWNSNIQVKNCSGYYVYNLIGPVGSKCASSYCTDPNSAPCKVDELWRNGNNGFGCYCRKSTNSLEDLKPDVTCRLRDMKASFSKCQINALRFPITQAKIQNGHCFTYEDDNFTNTISVLASIQGQNCGVQTYQNATHVIYSSSLYISQDFDQIIMRNDTLTINFNCVYPLDMETSLNFPLKPVIKNTIIDIGGTGQFNVTMALYKYDNYTGAYENPGAGGITLSTKTMLYVGIMAEGGDNITFVLAMRNCYATPTNNIQDPKKYYIIENSCPNKQDTTISVSENGVSRRGRFQVMMFKFVGDYDLVFLHCNVSLCNRTAGSCQPSCSGKSSGDSSADEKIGSMSLGPFIRSDSSSSSSVGSAVTSWSSLLSTLLMLMSTMFLQHLQLTVDLQS